MTIENGESGASVRAELNAALDKVNGDAPFTSVDINGSTIDGTVIGGTTPAAGSFTNTQLAAIAASKGVTAVDVFVYDTSKDSDGGAWRKRTQGTSWYNETLNTATRGSRREFPAVAVIVAETNKVTIYDGDDPSLPMWMVFNAANTSNLLRNAGVVSITMADGLLVAATVFAYSSVVFYRVSFVSDAAIGGNTSGQYTYNGNISTRNSGANSYTLVSGSGPQAIVNNTINDVAMTVLPDAPIDPATGLPVPTIAVATNGGVSVIKDDGTVVNSVSTLSYNVVDLTETHDMVLFRQADATYRYVRNGVYLSPSFIISNYNSQLSALPNAAKSTFSGNAFGGTSGVSLFDENPATPANGMVAYTTSTYNTGWMVGDVKGAFLSDTDGTDLVANDKITNGDNEASLFTPLAPTRATVAQSSEQASTGTFSAKATFSGGSASHYITAVSIPAGEAIYFSYDIYIPASYTGSGIRVIDTSDGSFSTATVNTRDAWVTVSGYRGAKATPWPLGIGQNSAENVDGQSVYIDNLTVKTLDADRSVNNNGLIVNGTVTRSPVATGADLVAYSGFSSSNYLEQPYNSDLDFGTGDFCVMGWVKATAANGTVFDRERIGRTTEPRFVIKLDASGNLAAYGVALSLIGSGTLVSSTWRFISAVRTSGVLRLYVDGVLYASGAFTDSVTDTSAVTRIGNQIVFNNPWAGSLALLRISATAPTAEQIAKIYNDEKVLFTEGSQATLYGSSDAVTALAHDDATNLLHVGTSSGRSVFQGLRRVDNTTTAVGTAISASNGLVVEE